MNISSILKDHFCKECNSFIIVNPSSLKDRNTYIYCSNLYCKHHIGTHHINDEIPDWVHLKNEMNVDNLLLTDQTYIKNIFTDAITTWGENSQIAMVIGEIGELLTEFGRSVQGRDSKEKWVDEISDVIIMMSQFAYIKGSDDVKKRISEKLPKLKDRIEKYKGNKS